MEIGRPRGAQAVFVVVSALALLGGAACTDQPASDEQVRLGWQEVSLPPVAPGERVALRAGAVCAGRWFLTGGIVSADGTPRPAAWTSSGGRTWTSMTLAPKTYYGRLNTIYAAACRDGRLAAIGDKTGGVHGNPRTSTWYQAKDGALTEVTAYFELYGGLNAVNVSRIAAGRGGWVIAGNRVAGAAAWVSADAAEFRIVEGAPGLASDAEVSTRAVDIVPVPGGWTIVGTVTAKGGINRDPAAWVSPDGLTWRRVQVPGTPDYEEMQRATTVGDQVVAIGPQGEAFGAWRGAAGAGDTSGGGSSWRAAGHFGSSGGPGRGFAEALAAVADNLYAATSDGTASSVWESRDSGASWRRVELPAPAPSGWARATVLVSGENQLLLIVDDGRAIRVWAATISHRS